MIFFINFHDFNHFKLLLNVKFPTDFKNSVYFNVLINIYIEILTFYSLNIKKIFFNDFY